MSDTVILILLAVGAVAFFVVGMSLTLIFKGHHIKSEIADNEHMRAMGIKCAAQQMLDEERPLRAEEPCIPSDCSDEACRGCPAHIQAGN